MASSNLVTCPHCQKKLKLKKQAGGKKVRCPNCQTPFRIPAGSTGGNELDDLDELDSFEAGASEYSPPKPPELPWRRSSRKTESESGLDQSTQLKAVIGGSALLGVVLVGLVVWAMSSDSPPAENRGADTGDEPTSAEQKNESTGSPTHPSTSPASKKIDFSYMLPEADLIASLRVGDLWETPLMQSLRDSSPAAGGLQRLEKELAAMGLPPGDVDRIQVSLSEILKSPPVSLGAVSSSAGETSVVVRSRKPIDIQKVVQFVRSQFPPGMKINQASYEGTSYFTIPSPLPVGPAGDRKEGSSKLAAFLADETTLVVCGEQRVKSLIEGKKQSSVPEKFRFVAPEKHLVVAIAPEDPAALMKRGRTPTGDLPILLENFQACSFSLDASEGVKLQIRGRYSDSKSSEAAASELERELQSVRKQFASWHKEAAPQQFSPVWDLLAEVLEGTQVSRKEAMVEIAWAVPASKTETLNQLPVALMSTLPMMKPPQMAGGNSLNNPMSTSRGKTQASSGGGSSTAEAKPSSPEPGVSSAQSASQSEGLALKKSLKLSREKPFGLFPPENEKPLFATLSLTGPAAGQASHYGFLKLTQSQVDGGKSLKLLKSSFSMEDPTEKFLEIDRNMMFPGEPDPPKDVLQFHLMLKGPYASAKQLEVLDGEVQVITGGEQKELVIENITDKVGQKLSHPMLKQAGLDIEVVPASNPRLRLLDAAPSQTVSLKIGGPKTCLMDFGLQNAGGKSLETELAWSGDTSSDEPVFYFLQSKKDLPPKTALRLSLAVGQKRLRVPFRFENVSLPGQNGSTTAKAADDGTHPIMAAKPDQRKPTAPTNESKVQPADPRRWKESGSSPNDLVSWSVHRIDFSPDGKLLAMAGYNGKFRVWDLRTNETRFVCEGHEDTVQAVVFSPDGSRLASASKDNTVRLWDTETGDQLQLLGKHWNRVLSADFSRDGSLLATGGRDWTVRLWEVDSGQQVGVLKGHTGWVQAVAFSPNDRWLVSAAPSPPGRDDRGEIIRWDWHSEVPTTITYGDHKNVDIVSRKISAKLAAGSGAGSIAFLPDSRRIVSATPEDRTVRLWNLTTNQVIQQWESLTGPVAVSPDGKLMAVCTGDGAVHLRSLPTGKLVVKWVPHKGEVKALAFSPDGDLLVTAGLKPGVRFWKVPAK